MTVAYAEGLPWLATVLGTLHVLFPKLSNAWLHFSDPDCLRQCQFHTTES